MGDKEDLPPKVKVDCYDWIIYLAGEWDQFFKRHLIHELARQLPQSRILCVARPMCLTTTLFRRPREFLDWLHQPGQITALDENLLFFRPGILLHDHLAGHVPFACQINRQWLQRQLHLAVGWAGLRSGYLISLIYDPFQLEYLDLIGESFSIYDCYDEYTAWAEIPFLRTKRPVLKREQAILKKVDLVFVVSEMIQRRVEKVRHRVHVVPNGVDIRHFGSVEDPIMDIASDMARIPHPLVGYLGNITSRIDFDLLIRLAATRPEWSIALVGGVSEQGFSIPNSLTKLPNVYCLGASPYEKLPGYLKAFDVCIVPYAVDNPLNIHCSPLKLYEYLATGKPIVSTDLPAVRAFDGLVGIAKDTVEFERQVAAALVERDKQLRERRLVAARENSWEKRVEQILMIVESALGEKHC